MTDVQIADRDRWIADAVARIDRSRLVEFVSDMVDIASPTGEEAALAEHLVGVLSDAGLDAHVQQIDDTMANAVATRPGTGAGVSLLLYAPIDTVTAGTVDEDLPWVGPELRPDMRAVAEVRDAEGLVLGLGAQNPKGHAACIVAAVEALAAAGLPLPGDLLVGFGAGGMPTNARRPGLSGGHGVGCRRVVEELRPDSAVIAKTGWAVSWEEVGLIWFEVTVGGTHTYVGSRHLLPYTNAIAVAGAIIGGLECWFETWAEQWRDGLVAPQGVVSAIEGGWMRMPAFTPARCQFRVDLRLSPRTTAGEAESAFCAEVDRLAAEHDTEVQVRRLVLVPGTITDPQSPIIRTTIAAWEAMEGRPHQPVAGLSGATDANILRAMGVPTARVGLPKVHPDKLEVDFQLGMNAVDVADMERLTELLIRVAIATCSHRRAGAR